MSRPWQDCPQCPGKTPANGKFCMHCGKRLKYVRTGDRMDKVAILRIAPNCNLSVLAEDVWWQLRETPTLELGKLRSVLGAYPLHQVQALIRFYGLDGEPPRTKVAISREFHLASGGPIKEYIDAILHGMRHPRYGNWLMGLTDQVPSNLTYPLP